MAIRAVALLCLLFAPTGFAVVVSADPKKSSGAGRKPISWSQLKQAGKSFPFLTPPKPPTIPKFTLPELTIEQKIEVCHKWEKKAEETGTPMTEKQTEMCKKWEAEKKAGKHGFARKSS